jgi:hypothetical protein
MPGVASQETCPAALAGRPAGAGRWLSELAGLVVAGGLPDDDVHAVPGVDESDDRHQRDELVIVVVLGRVRPGIIGHTAGGVGDAGALLGELQRGTLGLGEDFRLPPRRDQVQPLLVFPLPFLRVSLSRWSAGWCVRLSSTTDG